MSTDLKLMIKKLEFQKLALNAGYSEDEVLEMSMVELRDIVDKFYPLRIVSISASASGGKVRRVFTVKKNR